MAYVRLQNLLHNRIVDLRSKSKVVPKKRRLLNKAKIKKLLHAEPYDSFRCLCGMTSWTIHKCYIRCLNCGKEYILATEPVPYEFNKEREMRLMDDTCKDLLRVEGWDQRMDKIKWRMERKRGED